MHENSLDRAVSDIKLIREVIENTTSSIVQLSRMFTYLGFWFMAVGVFDIIFHFILTGSVSYGTLGTIARLSVYVTLPLLVLIFVLTLRTPMDRISRQLAFIWIFVFLLGLFGSSLFNLFSSWFGMQNMENFYLVRALQMLAYAFGFLCTGILSKFKLPGVFAGIFFVLGFFLMLPNHFITGFVSDYLRAIPLSYGQLTGGISDAIGIMVAITFLFMGYYLHYKKERSN